MIAVATPPSPQEALQELVTYPNEDDSQCGVPMSDSSFAVRETASRGLGLFAAIPIAANAFLFDYTGLTLPRREYRRAHCALCALCARIARSTHSAHTIPCARCALSAL